MLTQFLNFYIFTFCTEMERLFQYTFYLCFPKRSYSPLSNFLSALLCLLIWETHPYLFFPLGMCLCWWTIRVPEDTCHQGVFLSTSVDMKYCGWLRSIRTLKSIFNILCCQFYRN